VRFEERRRVATRNLGSAEVRIGRDPTCDWIVDYANVSRHHAVVRPLGDRNVVQDLGSTNGVRVNGLALGGKPHVLAPGDTIELTDAVVLLYEEGPFASSTPWVVTAIAMILLLIASIGLYLATSGGPAPVAGRARGMGPKWAPSGTHPGMRSAEAPHLPQLRPRERLSSHSEKRLQATGIEEHFHRQARDWRAVARVQSSGDQRSGQRRARDGASRANGEAL
jgi:hypothetical protein